MAPEREPQHGPWWQRQLETLLPTLREQLRRRLPALRSTHEDLLQEAVADLTARLSSHRAQYPASWYAEGAPSDTEEQSYFARLTQMILRRRVADHFRERVRDPARSTAEPPEPHESTLDAPPPVPADRAALQARMLALCARFVAALPEEDRGLVLLVAGLSDEEDRALDARERQRLHRVRARLGELVRKELGASAASLLGDA